jgi:hypothetical protein
MFYKEHQISCQIMVCTINKTYLFTSLDSTVQEINRFSPVLWTEILLDLLPIFYQMCFNRITIVCYEPVRQLKCSEEKNILAQNTIIIWLGAYISI